MKVIQIGLLLMALSFSLFAQTDKKPLTHDVYDSWNDISRYQISNDGKLVVYHISPQEGDTKMYIFNAENNDKLVIDRCSYSTISPNSNFAVFRIKPFHENVIKAKRKKVNKNKMPKDTLGLWLKKTNTITKVPALKSYKTPKEKSDWFVYLYEKEKEKKTVKDTTANEKKEKTETKEDKKPKKKKVKLKGNELVIMNPIKDIKHSYSNVTSYDISENGKLISFIRETGDTTVIKNLFVFNTESEETKLLASGENDDYKKITLSNDGSQLAYIFSNDTTKTKVYSLYYKGTKDKMPKKIADTLTKEIYKDWTVQSYSNIYFSQNNEKLYFGIAPKPVKKEKDTLLPEEKYHLDIWSWNDKYLQPMQKKNAGKEKNRTYLSVFYTKSGKIIQLADSLITDVYPQNFGDARYAVATDNTPYAIEMNWDGYYADVYTIDTKTGKKYKVLERYSSDFSISPNEKYIAYYQPKDSMWHIMDIKGNNDRIVTQSLGVNFYNELYDMPSDPNTYGIAGWDKESNYFLIYDKYDIWKIDPRGKEEPQNITKGIGRKESVSFRYIKLNNDTKYIDEQTILLKAFNNDNKDSGLYTLNLNSNEAPKKLAMEAADYSGRSIKKAKNADKLLWRKGDFRNYPELYYGNIDLSDAQKLSNTNPQQINYKWGSVKLVEWITGDGEKMKGKMYIPDNIDKNKKYPMLVYFYERSSDGLHQHFVPQPNWSIINISYCVSNDYIVFVPDITYHKVGYPGESAYSSIVTGTLAMLEQFPFIDKDNMALQGQSWGGYQIAYLVTRTNLYKCAMAGAPVTNMTSAYGGMRWASGMCRQFQYEKTQSRIGGTLWNKTIEYIENSPVFFTPKIETPLLIMHNDNDGAVPWYQGIELYNAMRRLRKPVWMLVYNNDGHNLRRRANRKDLSIRTMQFFDHYLKGEKIPIWMDKGVPAHKKGEVTGY